MLKAIYKSQHSCDRWAPQPHPLSRCPTCSSEIWWLGEVVYFTPPPQKYIALLAGMGVPESWCPSVPVFQWLWDERSTQTEGVGRATGWHIHGEHGNQVPTKFISSGKIFSDKNISIVKQYILFWLKIIFSGRKQFLKTWRSKTYKVPASS